MNRRICSAASITALALAPTGCGDQGDVPLADVPEVKTPAPRLPHPGSAKPTAGNASAPGLVTPPRSDPAGR